MNNALYALLPAMTQEAQNKLTRDARNQLFLRAILRDQFANSGNRSLASFISTKDSVDKEIELVDARQDLDAAKRRIKELEATIEAIGGDDTESSGDQESDANDAFKDAVNALVELTDFILERKAEDQNAVLEKVQNLNVAAKVDTVRNVIG